MNYMCKDLLYCLQVLTILFLWIVKLYLYLMFAPVCYPLIYPL